MRPHTHTASNRDDKVRQLHHAACSTTIVVRVFAAGREQPAHRRGERKEIA
jgi:hypothetical protein